MLHVETYLTLQSTISAARSFPTNNNIHHISLTWNTILPQNIYLLYVLLTNLLPRYLTNFPHHYLNDYYNPTPSTFTPLCYITYYITTHSFSHSPHLYSLLLNRYPLSPLPLPRLYTYICPSRPQSSLLLLYTNQCYPSTANSNTFTIPTQIFLLLLLFLFQFSFIFLFLY